VIVERINQCYRLANNESIVATVGVMAAINAVLAVSERALHEYGSFLVSFKHFILVSSAVTYSTNSFGDHGSERCIILVLVSLISKL